MALIINMACGLANRMFQYSYYRKLLAQGYDVKVDFFTSAKLAHENVDWYTIFPYAKFDLATEEEKKGFGVGNGFIAKLIRYACPSLTRVKEMAEAFTIYEPRGMNDNSYLLGVFQNVKVTEGIEEELKELFRFPDFTDINNNRLKEMVLTEESVAIHVRKGIDYQSRIWYKNTCPIDYYRKAVKLVQQKLESPKFYIFTDNCDWVRENFNWFQYKLVEGNPVAGFGSHFDMQLMSLCKHNIISNSTYSWWSAFLNANPEKIVILPNIWFNPEEAKKKNKEYTSVDLTCENWIRM